MTSPGRGRPAGADVDWRGEVVTTVATAGLVGILVVLGWLPALERPVGDLLLRLPIPTRPPPAPVVAVVIDDASVAEVGPWPWPRGVLARLVDAIHRSGARGVIVDVLLAEPREEAGDAALAAALRRGPAVLGAALVPGDGWLLPLPRFGGGQAAAHVHAEVGPDGVVRTIAATKQRDGLVLPALAAAAAATADPGLTVAVGTELRPDFRPRPQDIDTVSAVRLLRGDARTLLPRSALVFIGVTASGAGDQFVTPVQHGRRPQPGVLVHASAAASLLRGGLVTAPRTWLVILGALLVAAAAQAVRSRSGRLAPLALGGLAATIVVGAVVAILVARFVVPVVSLLAALAIAALLREAAESRLAQQRSGRLLDGLLERLGGQARSGLPSSTSDRLERLERLQRLVLDEDELRRTLLGELEDGVVLWDPDGRPRLANPTLTRLWGHQPTLQEIEALRAGSSRDPSWDDQVERGGRHLTISVRPVGARTLGLVRDVTVERELERRKREMQRLVSHELRTPLGSIGGLAGTLERYRMSEGELRRVATLIRRESDRLREMVTTFLELERLGAGARRTRVDLRRVVRDRLEVLAPVAAERDQHLDLHTDSPAVVQGDPDLLGRVVDNLVANAITYSDAGTTIRLEITADTNRVNLVVADEGPGIPPEALPRLFERFFRVPGTEPPGSGLGLSLVHEVVGWHGGCIDVHSEPGAGTTFTVRLPAARDGEENVGTDTGHR